MTVAEENGRPAKSKTVNKLGESKLIAHKVYYISRNQVVLRVVEQAGGLMTGVEDRREVIC
jgi:hypothetical protein